MTSSGQDDRTRYETVVAAESADSDVVLVALEEASRAVDAALNATIERLFSSASKSQGQANIDSYQVRSPFTAKFCSGFWVGKVSYLACKITAPVLN